MAPDTMTVDEAEHEDATGAPAGSSATRSDAAPEVGQAQEASGGDRDGADDDGASTPDALVAIVTAAVASAETDLEAALAAPVIDALARLRTARPPTFMRLRGELKRANADVSLAMLDTMIDAAAGAASAEGDGAAESGEKGPGAVEAIIDAVRAVGELFLGDDDEPYVRFDRDGHREVWALESRAFREWVGHQAYSSSGRAPRAAQLADAANVLGGIARHEGEQHAVHLRVAPHPHGDGYLIDTGDEAWRVIEVTPTGWRLLDESPARFRRTKGMKAMPSVAHEGGIEDLQALVNIAPESEPLLVAVLLECWRPDTAYPVVELGGEEGSGKSATATNLRALIDPTAVPLRAAPKSVEDLFVGARQNHVVNLNNLSHLTPEAQDGLCTLATGGGLAGRRLYTNDEEVVHEAKRPVWMNGIATLATQSDLLSRVVRIECPKLAEPDDGTGGTARVSDGDMAERVAHHGPRALRFLLDTFVAALARLPSVELARAPRLMDFARLGEAAHQARGFEVGDFTDAYVGALEEAAVQSLESSPVAEVLVEYAQLKATGSPLETTVGELFTMIDERAGTRRDRAWPKTSRGFGDAIRRAAPAMRLVGVTVKVHKKRRDGTPVTIHAGPGSLSARNIQAAQGRSRRSQRSQDAPETRHRDHCDRRDRHGGTLSSAAGEEPSPDAQRSRAPAPADAEEF